MLLYSCENVDYSKDDYVSTFKPINGLNLKDNLFIERYRIYAGGVLGGDVETVYVTDSLSFRKYLGKQFDDEMIDVVAIRYQSILVYKFNLHTNKLLNAKIYDIDELKKEGKFE